MLPAPQPHQLALAAAAASAATPFTPGNSGTPPHFETLMQAQRLLIQCSSALNGNYDYYELVYEYWMRH